MQDSSGRANNSSASAVSKNSAGPVGPEVDPYAIVIAHCQTPGQYIGGEKGTRQGDPESASVTMALAFPEVYSMGMSHLGLRILYNLANSFPGVVCERAFLPEFDVIKALKERELPLFSIESRRPLKSFDLLGFSVMHELSLPNVLAMLDLAAIPLRNECRTETDPIVVAGGISVYNPEPLSPFVDVFAIGDGEATLPDLLKVTSEKKAAGCGRQEILRALAGVEGLYVPAFYEAFDPGRGFLCRRPAEAVGQGSDSPGKAVEAPLGTADGSRGVPTRIRKRFIESLDGVAPIDPWVVPYIRIVHDRVFLEIMRGCTNNCRFCQAGILYRPRREKDVEKVLEEARQALSASGYDEVSLLSLSSSDHSQINDMVDRVVDTMEADRVAVAFPSLRLDRNNLPLIESVSRIKKTGLTFAPEAGTQRLRDVINKNITEEDIFRTLGEAVSKGWRKLKLYFMIGLPTETMEDVEGIIDLVRRIESKFRVTVNMTLSAFVPKAHTPFQWAPMLDRDELVMRMKKVKAELKGGRVSVSFSDAGASFVEAMISRGDSAIGEVIERAMRLGAIMGSHSEHFDERMWWTAASEAGIDPSKYFDFPLTPGDRLPWDHIDSLVSDEFLAREWNLAADGGTTPPCGPNSCAACGIDRRFCHR